MQVIASGSRDLCFSIDRPRRAPSNAIHHSGLVNQSIYYKVQSHHLNGLRTLLDNNINTLIKQSDTDITELSYSNN